MSTIYYARAAADAVADALGMSEETRKDVPEQVLHFVSLDGQSFLTVGRRPTPDDYDDLRAMFEPSGPGITPMTWGRPIVERTAGPIEVIGE